MVTGSHNPANYNGLKIMLGGETLSGDAIQKLLQRIQTGDLASGQGPSRPRMSGAPIWIALWATLLWLRPEGGSGRR